MASVSLDATLRENTGKGGARKLRAAARLPAVVYRAGQPATPIAIDPAAVELAFKKTGNRNTLVELDIAGDRKRTCLVREAQRHPVTRQLQHIDFYEVEPDQQVTVKVDVRPVGVAKGLKLGGTLRIIRRTLDVRCKPADIPPSIDVNVTRLGVGEFITVAGIQPPEGCELLYSSDFNVLTVVGKRVPIVVDDDDEEGDEAVAEA
ncbi:MAG: 50S ribosomal protein L25 [Deltaproteobacteria bacterium]|nr:MAG: 50S ribosomal protein L25 [Deltaproteobacteria bacterium]